ncbi:uncharacterized protein SEPMUDRAFT_16084, partial [Sphaerulina musiva SO2202]
ICLSYGIDFQNGGSYFIDVRSSESFTVVSQFSGCEPDTAAYVLLVDNNTGDQVECSGVATTPDWTNVISTCPIAKNEMSSGTWSVLVIGNNGDGSPYAWQRDFELTVGVPVTSTTTSTVTFTETKTPSTTVTTTSTIQTTTSVPNESTITITKPAATKTITITPRAQTVTSTKWLTRTVNTWTFTQSKVTKTILPTCTIPPRPPHADPPCRIFPTIIPLPHGLTISSSKNKPRAAAAATVDPPSLTPEEKSDPTPSIQKRSPDAPTITLQAPLVLNTTTTFLSPSTSTLSEIYLTTQTKTLTDPPSTVIKASGGTKTEFTTLLPTKTKTVTRIGYSTVTRTRTVKVTWTFTTTGDVPRATKTACREEGGNL